MPPVFGPSSPSSSRLWSRANGRATVRRPSVSAIRLASRPSSRSSTTTGASLAANRPARRWRASPASDPGSKTVTPLPAARPSCLITTPDPARAKRSAAPTASSALRATTAAAIRTPAATATSWQNPFEVSIRAAATDGPNVGTPASTRASPIPAASGCSGPTTANSTASDRARATTAFASSGSTSGRTTTRGSSAIPSEPGATITRLTPGSAPSFHASACSRAPRPSTRIRVGMTRLTALRSRRQRRAVTNWPPRALDRLRPLRTHRHEHDRRAGELLESRHVASGVLGQVAERANAVNRLVPAGKRLVDRPRARQELGRRRPRLDPPSIQLVRDAQPELGDSGQDVELVEHDRAAAVDPDRVANRDGIEPADTARPARRRADLVAALRDPLADRVRQLGRKRPRSDACRIRLHDADDLVDLERPDPATGARAAGDRRRRRHERAAAVVQVEQSSLCALQEDVVAADERVLDEPRGVDEVRPQPLAPRCCLLAQCVGVVVLGRAERRQECPLFGQHAGELRGEDLGLQQVAHP